MQRARTREKRLSRTDSVRNRRMRCPFVEPATLPDAHFFGAVGGAGGAEVHEIDAGDQKDKHGDDGEDVYELDIAVDF